MFIITPHDKRRVKKDLLTLPAGHAVLFPIFQDIVFIPFNPGCFLKEAASFHIIKCIL
jgi:hypothetical protein